MKNVMGIVLGGGKGSRLFPLTEVRSKPAVPLGGRYRLIDIPISNCINSNVNKIFVITQFNSESLNRHITQTYRFGYFWLPGPATPMSTSWPPSRPLTAPTGFKAQPMRCGAACAIC